MYYWITTTILSCTTRPDIAYTVGQIASFTSDPPLCNGFDHLPWWAICPQAECEWCRKIQATIWLNSWELCNDDLAWLQQKNLTHKDIIVSMHKILEFLTVFSLLVRVLWQVLSKSLLSIGTWLAIAASMVKLTSHDARHLDVIELIFSYTSSLILSISLYTCCETRSPENCWGWYQGAGEASWICTYILLQGIKGCDECGYKQKSALMQDLHSPFDLFLYEDLFLVRRVKLLSMVIAHCAEWLTLIVSHAYCVTWLTHKSVTLILVPVSHIVTLCCYIWLSSSSL